MEPAKKSDHTEFEFITQTDTNDCLLGYFNSCAIMNNSNSLNRLVTSRMSNSLLNTLANNLVEEMIQNEKPGLYFDTLYAHCNEKIL